MTPFSFINWEECFASGYDRYCQDLWDWNERLDNLYGPDVSYRRLPWVSVPAVTRGDQFLCPGYVSVCGIHDPSAEGYFEFEDPACEWEPLDSPLFWDDLGFSLIPSDYAISTLPTSTPVNKLIAKLSTPHPRYGYCDIPRLELFASGVIAGCSMKGIQSLAGLYCAYNVAYTGEPRFGLFCSGHVEFLGCYPYQ